MFRLYSLAYTVKVILIVFFSNRPGLCIFRLFLYVSLSFALWKYLECLLFLKVFFMFLKLKIPWRFKSFRFFTLKKNKKHFHFGVSMETLIGVRPPSANRPISTAHQRPISARSLSDQSTHPFHSKRQSARILYKRVIFRELFRK